MIAITLYMVGGRRHALRRVRAGRKPALGTGWLLSRQERALVDPRYAAGAPWPGHGHGAVYMHYAPGPDGGPPPPPPPGAHPVGGGWYHMSSMPAPPPVYDANRPPMYDEAAGAAPAGTKVDPNQQGGPGGDYAPPSGPPPGR